VAGHDLKRVPAGTRTSLNFSYLILRRRTAACPEKLIAS